MRLCIIAVMFGLTLGTGAHAQAWTDLKGDCTEKQLKEWPDSISFEVGKSAQAFREAFGCDVLAYSDLLKGFEGTEFAVLATLDDPYVDIGAFSRQEILVRADLLVVDATASLFGTDYATALFWSDPTGAQIWIGDKPRGTTEVTMAVRSHLAPTIWLSMEGYENCGPEQFERNPVGADGYLYFGCVLKPSGQEGSAPVP